MISKAWQPGNRESNRSYRGRKSDRINTGYVANCIANCNTLPLILISSEIRSWYLSQEKYGCDHRNLESRCGWLAGHAPTINVWTVMHHHQYAAATLDPTQSNNDFRRNYGWWILEIESNSLLFIHQSRIPSESARHQKSWKRAKTRFQLVLRLMPANHTAIVSIMIMIQRPVSS